MKIVNNDQETQVRAKNSPSDYEATHLLLTPHIVLTCWTDQYFTLYTVRYKIFTYIYYKRNSYITKILDLVQNVGKDNPIKLISIKLRSANLYSWNVS